MADACECGNEPSGSVKCGEFLDYVQASQLLRKDSAPWSKEYLLIIVVSYYENTAGKNTTKMFSPSSELIIFMRFVAVSKYASSPYLCIPWHKNTWLLQICVA